jgi:hypothetical protein
MARERANAARGTGAPGNGRRFIGVLFRCCHVYARIYLNAGKTAFVGHCPRCGGRLAIRVAPGGSRARFWTAD